MTKKKKWFLISDILFLAVILIVVVVFAIVRQDEANVSYDDNGLPILELNLSGVTFDEIKENIKGTKYPGNELKIYDDNNTLTFSNVEVKGRGNSTWGMPKKPLQIKLDEKADLFGMGRARKWVLIANFFDDSRLRNDIASVVAEMLNIGQAQKGEYVELYIDKDYQGLYYLTHKVEIDKQVVDLRNSMGILVEVDNLHGMDTGCYWADDATCLTVKDMVSKDLEATTMEDFVNDFNELVASASAGDFTKVNELIDVKSFAEYYLLSEFTVNPDAYTSSWFIYKDGEDDLIHAGPGWDFDYALGNRNWVWQTSEEFYSPEKDMIREIDVMGGKFVVDGKVIEKEADGQSSKLMYHLMKIPEFRETVDQVFRTEMSGRKSELLSHLKWQASRIYSAVVKDSEKWEKEFNDEIDYLTDWVSRRYDHFEKTYGSGEEGQNVVMTEV